MLGEVALAGIRLTWRFGTDTRFASWLRERPWTSRGGVVVAHVTGPEQAAVVSELAVARLRESDGQKLGRDLELRLCELDPDLPSPLQQVQRWLEMPVQVPGSAFTLRDTARRVAELERVWIVSCHAGGPDRPWRTGLRCHVEDLNKADADARLAVVVLTPDAPDPDGVDLRCGQIAGPLGAQGALARWDAYVHTRLAWEAAGNLDRATSLHDRVTTVRRDDDAGLERCLNEWARLSWRDLDGAVRERILRHCSAAVGAPAPDAWGSEPELEPFVWNPGGVVLPVPWLARALLTTGAGHPPLRGLLRCALVCAPLRDAVAARCLAAESRLRAAAEPTAPPPVEAEALLRHVEAGRAYECLHYPEDAAAIPRSAWDLVSLGDFIRALPPAHPRRGLMEDIRILRNAVLHGHYVSWKTLVQADLIARRMR